MPKPRLSDDGRTVTVRVPISIKRRGGRKLVLAPDGSDISAPFARHIDNAMVKSLARAFRWREMIESGAYATIRELAAAENINETYVGRTLRLTLLAPDTVEGVLAGRQSVTVGMSQLMEGFPLDWKAQCAVLSGPERSDDRRGSGYAAKCPSRI